MFIIYETCRHRYFLYFFVRYTCNNDLMSLSCNRCFEDLAKQILDKVVNKEFTLELTHEVKRESKYSKLTRIIYRQLSSTFLPSIPIPKIDP